MRLSRRHLRAAILFSAVLVATGIAAAIRVDVTEAQSAGPAPDRTGAGDSGREIWQQDCAICHGVRGAGSFQGPDISDKGPASVDFQVRTGRMPRSFRTDTSNDGPVASPTYSEDQIRSLVAYTGEFVRGPSVPTPPDTSNADVAAGGELYRLNCSACHQMAGSGGALAYGTVGPSLTNSTPLDVVEAMRTGPGSMPVFPPSVLDDEEATQIAAYVDYLHAPDDPGGLDLWHLGPVPEGLIAWIFGVGGAVLICRWLGTRSRVET